MIEVLALILAAGVFLTVGPLARAWERAYPPFARLAKRPLLSVALVGLVAGGGSAAVGLLIHMPVPTIHDDFSYLLAADTFALGRMSNPTHPLWKNFEDLHVLQKPTYSSKYPPAHGLALAAGQVLLGHPVAGVWAGAALGCAASCWMLYAWVPAPWALFGGLLLALRLGIASYWSQGYHGGWIAALGGALVFGSLRRLRPDYRTRHAVLLGIGLGVLAASRPYEGLLVCLPVPIVLLWWLFRENRAHRRRLLLWVGAPLVLVLVTFALLLGTYNERVTSSALLLPYQAHDRAYAMAPSFLWQRPLPPPTYSYPDLQDFYAGWEFGQYARERTLMGWLSTKAERAVVLWAFFLGPALTLPFLLCRRAPRDLWTLLALSSCSLLIAGLAGATYVNRHYAAPALPLLMVLCVQAMRAAWAVRPRGLPIGQAAVRSIPLTCLGMLLVSCLELGLPPKEASLRQAERRAGLLADLLRQGGKHLVLVRDMQPTANNPDPYIWLYNRADIDGSRVVWARDPDPLRTGALLAYFKNRRVWRLRVDDGAALVPGGGP